MNVGVNVIEFFRGKKRKAIWDWYQFQAIKDEEFKVLKMSLSRKSK